jgi:hypothetical protein
MIRSTYRNLMLGLLGVCFGISFFVFRTSQNYQSDISNRESDIIRLGQEYDNAQSLDVALKELDSLTITEQTATQLDILRHLGLEQSTLDFNLESRESQSMGATTLYIHNVRIAARMPYPAALQLADRLQNTNKIILNAIELAPTPGTDSSDIALTITGRIYGLDKTPVPEAPAPAAPAPETAVPVATSPSATQPAPAEATP